jgi:phosphoribosylformylglycinamidine synthase
VWGICNGFQILTEAGLLEGALLKNLNQKYICKNIHLKSQTTSTILTQNLSLSQPYQIPIAHGDGRFYADADTLKKLEDKEQILFRYCDSNGDITEESNPNGSLINIAGICNKERNVFGMMPHPERAADPMLSNTDGRAFFESILGTVMSN